MQDYPLQVRDRLINYRHLFQKELIDSELSQLSTLADKLEKNTIAIAVFGMVSRGKSSLINALLGQKISETGAIHGVTKDVVVYEWEAKGKLQIRLIDTQGIDEVGGGMREELALKAAKQADLILFVIAGDMTRLEQEAIAHLQTFYKPILLVFNKTDLYTTCDRVAIHAALQNPEMQKLISPQEIVLVAADPKPIKVRLQYSDGRSQEVWEKPQPETQELKERILDLLNTEGKALLALNVSRSLLEIQEAVTHRHLQKLQSSTAIATFVFISEAIAILLAPALWLDALVSGTLSSLLAIWTIGKYPIQKQYVWLIMVIAIATLSGVLGLDYEVTRYVQILWTGLSLVVLLNGITKDIAISQGYGKLGAKSLIEQIIHSVPDSSILQRFRG
ncbi:50S ribosome-binding GTPase [Pseudanabaena sp. FACHB-1998]|uniref:Era-like GTP-binding protein n=1 Tax=Pseudanabaena sp. FACHB-1998 TaxID=2692858 RepID=UPI00168055E9|nr:Era-like GTP-binding protein [Pseudanabaena sp. FACHB-1998]MBD2175912.1 50S ribosome-binding GTPase [Pseudanabaena sp. FACHB-1998]